MSSDKDNEYFADGITESLLDVMAKEKELKEIDERRSQLLLMIPNLPDDDCPDGFFLGFLKFCIPL